MHLLELLEVIDAFHRAPVTKRALFPTGAAPYQPLLILSLIGLFRRPNRRAAVIEYEHVRAEYRALFESFYGPQDDSTFSPKAVQPFWVFGSGRSISPPLWRLVPAKGKATELEDELANRTDPLKSETRLRELVAYAELPPETFQLLGNRIAQEAVIAFTLQRYFPAPAEVIKDLFGALA